jgi:NAD(P)-dependent dehydrogenase (short-subunit alcohol dehydrogenase family)
MPQPDLSGTVVIVTGAAGGLGSVMTLSLAEAGASVAAFDIESSKARMDALLTAARDRQCGARVRPFWCDIRDPASAAQAVAAAASAFGGLHGLVNNAGLGPMHGRNLRDGAPKFYEIDLDVWRSRIDTNLTGAFIMAKTVAPIFVAQKRGKIVNVTTSYFTMTGGGLTPYAQAKAGLEAATASWSKDLAGSGVTVNALLPGGAANTPMVPPEVEPDRAKLVQPEVMAAPIRWLMSRAADGVTGRRFIGKDWDPALEPGEAAQNAGAPAAW